MATERREGTNEVTRTVRPDLASEDVRKGKGVEKKSTPGGYEGRIRTMVRTCT